MYIYPVASPGSLEPASVQPGYLVTTSLQLTTAI